MNREAMHRGARGVMASALVLAWPSLARAQGKPPSPPIRLALYYSVPERMSKSCYDFRDFKDRVYVAIRYEAFQPPPRDGTLRVEIDELKPEAPGPAGLPEPKVQVTWIHEGPSGKPRRAPYQGKAPTCTEALDDAISALKDYLPPAPARTPPVPPPPVFASLGGGLGVRLGSSRAPAVGLGVDVGVRWRERPFSLALELRAALPALADVATLPGTRIGTWLVTGAVVPCGRVGWFFGCGIVEAGVVRTTGAELAAGSDSSGPYVAMGGRAGVEIPIKNEPLALRLSGDLTGVLTSTRISSPAPDADGDIWKMPRVNGTFTGSVVGFFGR